MPNFTLTVIEDGNLVLVEEPPGTVDVIVPVTPEILEIATPGPQGAPGPQGQPGVGGTPVQEFLFSTPAATWTVSHGFGSHPIVAVLDDTLAEMTASVEWPDLNTVVVTHATPTTGRVLVRE